MPFYKAVKQTKYRTRRLLPGDVFEIDDSRDGRLWSKILLGRKHVVEHREAGRIAAPPPSLTAKIAPAPQSPPSPAPQAPEVDDVAVLRAEYHQKFGRRPFMGWDAATLREKMGQSA